MEKIPQAQTTNGALIPPTAKKQINKTLLFLLILSLIVNVVLGLHYLSTSPLPEATVTPTTIITKTTTPTATISESPLVTPTVLTKDTPFTIDMASADSRTLDLKLEITLPAGTTYIMDEETGVKIVKGTDVFMTVYLPGPVPTSLQTYTNKVQVLAPNINNLYRLTLKLAGDPSLPIAYTNEFAADFECTAATQIGGTEAPCSDPTVNLKNGLKLNVTCSGTTQNIGLCDTIIKTMDLKKTAWQN